MRSATERLCKVKSTEAWSTVFTLHTLTHFFDPHTSKHTVPLLTVIYHVIMA